MKKIIESAIGADRLSPAEQHLFGKMLFTYGWRVSAFAFFLWALGVFKGWGLGYGFAFAEDVAQQESVIKNVELKLLEQDIMTTFKESCAAPSKDYFRSRLNELQREYSKKNDNRLLNLPTCRDLGIGIDG